MAITGGHIRVTYRYVYLGQQCQNVQLYRLDGAAFLTATMEGVLEALWNDVKGVLRAITPNYEPSASWQSLLGYEIGGGQALGEFTVPALERVGTRAQPSGSEMMTGVVAGAFRQTVATRVTRPGQKRFPFLLQEDVANDLLVGTYVTLLAAVGAKFSSPSTLGAPVATGVMHPEVGGTEVNGIPTVFQDITGYVINPWVSSQVSRKHGHGS